MNAKDQLLTNFRLNVQQQMRHQKISQTQLADNIGLSQGTLSNVLNGHRQPTLWLAHLICQGLSTTLDQMLKPMD